MARGAVAVAFPTKIITIKTTKVIEVKQPDYQQRYRQFPRPPLGPQSVKWFLEPSQLAHPPNSQTRHLVAREVPVGVVNGHPTL